MKINAVTTATGVVAVSLACGTPLRIQAQDHPVQYPAMAPLDQYLMDRSAEIALARSAGPESISRHAKVVVLGRQGYETAVEGQNGFVCVVERSWMNLFNAREFWNPKIRGPICFNPPAVRSILPITYMRSRMVLAGVSKARMVDQIKAAYASKELPPLEPGAMCYMLSKQGYLTDNVLTSDGAHDIAHLMFYTTLADSAAWGADMPGSPVYLNPQFKGAPEPIDVFMVLTGAWSDGTSAPVTLKGGE